VSERFDVRAELALRYCGLDRTIHRADVDGSAGVVVGLYPTDWLLIPIEASGFVGDWFELTAVGLPFNFTGVGGRFRSGIGLRLPHATVEATAGATITDSIANPVHTAWDLRLGAAWLL